MTSLAPTRFVRRGMGCAAVVSALVAGACSAPKVSSGPGRQSGQGSAADTGGTNPDRGLGGDAGAFTLPDGGPDGPAAPPAAGGDKCAEESHKAMQVPLDLLLLVDTSGSMNNRVGTSTKWIMARDALTAFLTDPASAGLGVGLLTFPATASKPCTSDGDCGLLVPGLCGPRSVCLPAGSSATSGPSCGLPFQPCAAGTTCTPLGRCSVSGGDCARPGGACDTQMPGDTCVAGARWCRVTIGVESPECEASHYGAPTVAIDVLPAVAPKLQQALGGITPSGTTPMVAATAGALGLVKQQQAMHPDRRAVLVLATDGFPEGCLEDQTVDMVAANLAAAHAGSPAISTYVIGVFDDGQLATAPAALGQLATAGGSAAPFIIAPNESLTQKFEEALNQIRGAALACAFEIPQPAAGALDYGKVNVHDTASGTSEDLLYVGSVDHCDPTRGGWYYDVDPKMGKPTRILVCPTSCTRLKMDSTASVEVRVGCTTRID